MMLMIRSMQAVLIAVMGAGLATSPSAFARPDPQTSAAVSAASVAIGGDVATPQRFDAAALQALPRMTLEASDHGLRSRWQGVALSALLQRAGAPLGAALRGRNLALYVRVTAADGYRAVYSLAELDPALHANEVILADRRDGHALDAKEGPFRIVAKDDRRPARWVRQVIAIDVLAAP